MQWLHRYNRTILLFCLLLLAGFSRKPLLGPDRAILDGDEAVLGLMSKHQLEEGEIPVYFWGQNYGLSFFEVSAVSLFQSQMGYSDLAVKYGILLIWLLAVACAYFFLTRFQSPWLAFSLCAFLVLHPAWFHWSIKARGGYITALALSNWALYLVTDPRAKIRNLILGAVLVALTYQAHRLWFPPTLLLTLALLPGPKRKMTTFLMATAVSFAGLFVFSRQFRGFWDPHVVNLSLWKENLGKIPERILHVMEGNYVLGDIHPVNTLTRLSAICLMLLGLLALLQFIYGWKKEHYGWRDLLILLACFSPLGVLLIADVNFGPRYLLPFPFFLLFFIILIHRKHKVPAWCGLAFVPLSVLAYLGSVDLKDTGHYAAMRNDRLRFHAVCDSLVADSVLNIFSENRELVWLLPYYSQEKITASWILHEDRYNPYPEKVREDWRGGKTTGLLSSHPHQELGMDSLYREFGYLYLIRNPDEATLKRLDFQLQTWD